MFFGRKRQPVTRSHRSSSVLPLLGVAFLSSACALVGSSRAIAVESELMAPNVRDPVNPAIPHDSDSPAPTLPRFFSCFGAGLTNPQQALHYQLLIWHNHPLGRDKLVGIRRIHPNLKTFMYRELFSILRTETPLEESVGNWDWINREHPEWFQKDTQGRRVEVPDYPGQWVMDVRNRQWQDFWIQQTLKDVVDGGWDGVFADDALTTLRAHKLPPLQGYPDDASLQDAVYGFLVRITETFHAAGKRVIANVSNSYDYPDLWSKWLAATDGILEEHFAGESWGWGKDVAERQLEALHEAERQQKWALCVTYGGWQETEKMETSLAAYLIAAGRTALWTYRPYDKADEPAWHSSWAVPLGSPLAGAEKIGGVWFRRFEGGTVVLNTSTTPQSVAVNGQVILLKPRQGKVLT